MIVEKTIAARAPTGSQTIGPYWHMLDYRDWHDLTRFGAGGERIRLVGTIRDGDGKPCPDSCVELWQPSPAASDVWDGFGRAEADATGTYAFTTLKPGPVPLGRGRNGVQAPHAALTIFGRGLMLHLHTRLYFEGEPLNDEDPLLASLDAARRATLVAQPEAGHALPTWRLDIRLQGDGETVFLDI